MLKWLTDANNLTAISTLVIAFFTVVLAFVGWRQAKLTRQAIALARDEFNATNRPELFVRDVHASSEGDRTGIAYTVVNRGKAPCNITRSALVAEVVDTGKLAVNLRPTGKRNDVGAIALAPGQTYEGIFSNVTEAFEFGFFIESNKSHDFVGELHFAGAIEYTDASQIVRRVVFRRRFEHASQRFVETGDPETNYSD